MRGLGEGERKRGGERIGEPERERARERLTERESLRCWDSVLDPHCYHDNVAFPITTAASPYLTHFKRWLNGFPASLVLEMESTVAIALLPDRGNSSLEQNAIVSVTACVQSNHNPLIFTKDLVNRYIYITEGDHFPFVWDFPFTAKNTFVFRTGL